MKICMCNGPILHLQYAMAEFVLFNFKFKYD